MKSGSAVQMPIGTEETSTTIKAYGAGASPPKVVVLANNLRG
jgi:hypothetical protein